MKKILITAGGTATAWHFCQVIKKYFSNDYEIHVADINEEYLVPSSIYAKKFHKIPGIFEENYEQELYKLLEKEEIDIIIPLIDFDLLTFSSDNDKLKKLNVITTSTKSKTIETLSDKLNLFDFCKKNDIKTPEAVSIKDINMNKEYIIKPKKGFGSLGVKKLLGKEIKENKENKECIIQEVCQPEEITAEIYNGYGLLKIFQRKRVATKSGVCTKMIPVYYEEIDQTIKKLINSIECPKAFCIQFMKNSKNEWCIVDCNLRIGAGTALSTKIGFQLVRALLTDLKNEKPDENLFIIKKNIKSVLRVFEEVVIE